MFFNEWIASGALIGVALIFLLVRQCWRGLGALSRSRTGLHPEVEIQQEGGTFLFNLAISNNSGEEVWAENCDIRLSEFEGEPSHGFAPSLRNQLSIRIFVPAGQRLRVGLSRTVYEAAGRPQGEYSFVISGTLKYGVEDCCYYQDFKSRRVKMFDLDPIEVRKVRRPAKHSVDDESVLLEAVRH